MRHRLTQTREIIRDFPESGRWATYLQKGVADRRRGDGIYPRGKTGGLTSRTSRSAITCGWGGTSVRPWPARLRSQAPEVPEAGSLLAGPPRRRVRVSRPTESGARGRTPRWRSFRLIWCDAPDSVLAERLRRRAHDPREVSDAGPDLLPQHRAHYEPPVGEANVVRIDTTTGVDRAAVEAVSTLGR
jgi:hypothetical protein